MSSTSVHIGNEEPDNTIVPKDAQGNYQMETAINIPLPRFPVREEIAEERGRLLPRFIHNERSLLTPSRQPYRCGGEGVGILAREYGYAL